ncbi:MAG: type I glyceraldehyde-3-phosphate dehydrogenase [Candidatus Sungbacteria bacterium RIFCSPLOWO2_01_FULL_54_21]|uniref:Type I glyceraldehyde-3-phosphate dehydrogenase n=2 Tax=Candidatus Sungiibacteriota TaxID=1817917 RepID=A0A1G2L6S1_9BACT|nr:MAG: type I glyceraldehyde-3-phosphate dehydrogenase [Candidatus Sungbacteria bacterium RIFCSPHIGHO2_01_FULL_54_26]OHA03376.1 MAG: type I glyceraldehyde-3-phosphate dehydrogenase [Candidatus Sungbacteria bacterium RIFCSPHIGHO2_02_FULL_53_17]OHA07224.1 MAG: type I glyceraldehyde-3-phosphate dehydrogenase [Candidatus Sungbacteria bacterium RIFCSPLOWO2_01_FULL_54_21]
MKTTRVAINGFGRIGRSFFRAVFSDPAFEIVAINDLADIKTLAYLLKYDSVYGRYKKEVTAGAGAILVDGKSVPVFAERNLAALPWGKLGVDIIIEATGVFASDKKSQAHLDAGAKRVVITAPATGDGVTTALIGVNDDRFASALPITANASCTTNSVAPVMAILQEQFGIQKAGMVTVHGYTATQKLVDGPDEKDMRRGRAAAVNIVPSTTGAADAVIQAIPELAGKFDAVAVRVPVIAGSLSVMTVLIENKTTREEVNDVFRKSAAEPRWSKVLETTDEPLVSSDILGEKYGAIVDCSLTKVVDGNLLEVFSWYDNEAGYTATLIEHMKRIAALV